MNRINVDEARRYHQDFQGGQILVVLPQGTNNLYNWVQFEWGSFYRVLNLLHWNLVEKFWVHPSFVGPHLHKQLKYHYCDSDYKHCCRSVY